MKPKTVGRVLTQKGAAAQNLSGSPGLVAGTTILTGDGALPIEFLTQGDRIISRLHGMVRLEKIEASTQSVHLIRIAQGAFGEGCPRHTTLVPAAQPLLRRRAGNQTVSPAGFAVNDVDVTDLGPRSARCFKLFFARPEVIYADGLEVAVPSLAAQDARAA